MDSREWPYHGETTVRPPIPRFSRINEGSRGQIFVTWGWGAIRVQKVDLSVDEPPRHPWLAAARRHLADNASDSSNASDAKRADVSNAESCRRRLRRLKQALILFFGDPHFPAFCAVLRPNKPSLFHRIDESRRACIANTHPPLQHRG